MSAPDDAPHRLGVLGWPVAHSRSPVMQRAALEACGLVGWTYQLLPVPPQLFTETVRALPGAGFVGGNVTVPHKHDALALADRPSRAAAEIGAANTLIFEPDGTIAVENSDAPGLIAAIGTDLTGRTAMVLGAGGTARASAWALREAGAEVTVWNRTPERAAKLARDLDVSVIKAPIAADLLVNTTTVGMDGYMSESEALTSLGLDSDLLSDCAHVVDFVYTASSTPLTNAARKLGIPTVDGLAILVAQGAVSFELWTGLPAPFDVMERAARAV
ncbi:MAG TPA: shikimate dehydrogenase [Polyangiaceae bacterium]